MKKDDYVKIVGVDNKHRYGYISEINDQGFTLVISMFDEGQSKVAYDSALAPLLGEDPIDYISGLTDIEKRLVALLSTGNNTREIAVLMDISPATVRVHLRTLRIKLQLDDRAQLCALSPALVSMINKQAGVDKEMEDWKNRQNS